MLFNYFILIVSLCYGVSAGQDYDSCEQQNNNLEYPCEELNFDCVRDYLSQTGQCERSCHQDGVPIDVQTPVYAYIPSVKFATICKCDKFIFEGSKLEAFYINKDTNTLVITVDFKTLEIVSLDAVWIFEDVQGEPLNRTDHVNATYSVSLTGMIPFSPCGTQLLLEDATVTVHNKDPCPLWIFGPKITKSKNKVIRKTINAMLDNIETSTLELFLTKRYYFFHYFMRAYICDYGYEFDGRLY